MNSIVFQRHKKNRIATFKFTLTGVNFFCKKNPHKITPFEKIRHIRYVQIKKEMTTCRQQ